ncbi:MAG: SDR family NAD-dependent epimerase/dehydratase [Candidatus Nanohalarchaeota archaeon]|nr:MAG: SDR family NAD-dependent epimerase/dehydratase [Candidatus Nanohaloarchaeota archaeon]
MKILVAGGAGFIGCHLVKRLIEDGNKVTVIDNFSSGRMENIKGQDINIINHNIIDKITLSGFDQIYHLASLASPVFYQKNPVETALSNSVGTYNLLNEAQKHKSRILFTSTSEIYGDPKEHPQKEEYWGNVNSIGIRSCYDESKRLGETLMMDFNREYGVETRIARIFNTYGPKMSPDDGRVVSNFINQALKNIPITIYGDGKQTRSFCYIADTVDGLIKLMNSDYTEPVNIGNPEEMTMLELAERVIKITHSQSKIIYSALPKDDPVRRCPYIMKAKKILKWEPEIGINEGLEKTTEHFRKL